ncbi:USP6 N-terminal-like protein [Blattella germanica]|nr:USP6 N-terminal-like protein [Blattella germanica]
MLQRAWSLAPEIRQIDLDINRTFNSHEMFHERYGLKQQALFNVLSAYSVYNGEVGYCQGMSEIAAVFLMYLDEEEAFWAIHTLMSDKKYSMHGLFIPEFPKFKRFCTHHEKIMAKFLPKLKKHFESCGIEPQIYTLKWILQCFMTSIPFSLSLRVWDVYLLEGERVEIGMAYTVHKMHKMHLSRLPFDSILPYLQRKLPADFGFEDDAVMTTLERALEELRRAKLDHMGSPPENELPKYPYGTYIPPPHERKVTQRTTVLNRDTVITEGNSRISVEGGGLGGSKFSFDPSIDDASSLLDCHLSGSRRSLADTSVTSTADLSVFSTTTRSQALDNSLDAHSNASDGSGGGPNIPGIGHPSSIQRGPSAHSTPRATAHAPSPDVVRIYVPYASSSPTPAPSPQNGDVPRSLPHSLPDQNKIRIRVDTQDEQTPVVEHEQLIRPFRLDSPEIDLK